MKIQTAPSACKIKKIFIIRNGIIYNGIKYVAYQAIQMERGRETYGKKRAQYYGF